MNGSQELCEPIQIVCQISEHVCFSGKRIYCFCQIFQEGP